MDNIEKEANDCNTELDKDFKNKFNDYIVKGRKITKEQKELYLELSKEIITIINK